MIQAKRCDDFPFCLDMLIERLYEMGCSSMAHALPGAMRPYLSSSACTSTRRTLPTVGEPRLSAVLGGKPMSRSNGEEVSVKIIPNETGNPAGKLELGENWTGPSSVR